MNAQACPVCYGQGTKPASFYGDRSTSGAAAISCKSCAGYGYVLVPSNEPAVITYPAPPGRVTSISYPIRTDEVTS